MTELQQNRYDALMRRVGDLKGPGSKVNDVLEELFPVLDVENVPGELLLLMGTTIGFGGGVLAAVAAQSGKFQLFNPVGSGKLVTITKVYFVCQATGPVRWATSTIAFGAGIGTETSRDTRRIAADQPIANVRQLSAVAAAGAISQIRNPADTPFILSDRNGVAVLAPGTGFEIGSAVLNASTAGSFQWRERVAEPSELNV